MILSLKDKQTRVTAPHDAVNVIRALLDAEDEVSRDKEHFWVIHLNARNTIKVLELVSLGTLDKSLVHPREVFTRAVANRSASIILVHNHPSGECHPSNEDISVTENLVKAGQLLEIEVADHLIVTDSDFYSFKQEGMM